MCKGPGVEKAGCVGGAEKRAHGQGAEMRAGPVYLLIHIHGELFPL